MFMWQTHPKSHLEAVLNSSLNIQMSAIVPSQPQELEISAQMPSTAFKMLMGALCHFQPMDILGRSSENWDR